MGIGAVASRAGVRPSALRYYERIGLLPTPERENGQRRYDGEVLREVLDRLAVVDLVLAPVGVGEAEVQQRAHVRHRPVARPFGYHPPKDLPERLFAGGVEREVVQPAAPEHRPGARRLDARHLEGVQHRARANLDEGVAEALFFQVDRHPRFEDALVEGDQPVHVGGDERRVVDAVWQSQPSLLLLFLTGSEGQLVFGTCSMRPPNAVFRLIHPGARKGLSPNFGRRGFSEVSDPRRRPGSSPPRASPRPAPSPPRRRPPTSTRART